MRWQNSSIHSSQVSSMAAAPHSVPAGGSPPSGHRAIEPFKISMPGARFSPRMIGPIPGGRIGHSTEKSNLIGARDDLYRAPRKPLFRRLGSYRYTNTDLAQLLISPLQPPPPQSGIPPDQIMEPLAVPPPQVPPALAGCGCDYQGKSPWRWLQFAFNGHPAVGWASILESSQADPFLDEPGMASSVAHRSQQQRGRICQSLARRLNNCRPTWSGVELKRTVVNGGAAADNAQSAFLARDVPLHSRSPIPALQGRSQLSREGIP